MPEVADEPRPSQPAGPLAIEHLARSVDGMCNELRLVRADLASILNELTGVMRRSADHEIRITNLEIKTRKKHRVAKVPK